MPEPLPIIPITTPKSWTPQELELLNKNLILLGEAYRKGIPGVQGPQGIQGIAGPQGPAGPTGPAGVWPIGAVFISVVSTNPNTLLGYGTWASIGAGRVLVGLDSGDTDFDTIEETGGTKTKSISAHSGTAVADHGQATTSAGDITITRGNTGSPANVADSSHVHTVDIDSHAVTQPSNHSDISVVQPYLVVYMWKRTA